ncbi:MAG: type III secretion system cytoplasmic ring protein SctQ [Chloracidobacterium sp.]
MSQTLDDPFAFDLFAQPIVAPVEPEAVVHPVAATAPRERRWTDALPKCSQAEVAAGRELGGVPTWLFGAMFRAAAARLLTILRTPPELFGMTSFGLAEVSADELCQTTEDRRFCTTLGIGPDNATLFLQADAGFAAALVERMLGGNGTPPETPRQVSSAEATALEFLLLTLAWDINAFLGEPALRLTSCARWLSFGHFQSATSTAERHHRHLVGTVSLKFAEAVGFAEFIFDVQSLAAFRAIARRTLERPVTDPALALIRQKHVADLATIVPSFPMAVVIGTVEGTYGELQSLEIGDFVIIETVQSALQPGGVGTVVIGSPDAVLLFGELDEAHRLTVQDLLPAALLAQEESTPMPTNESTSDSPAIALEELTVTVRIELAARRMRLEELAQLRPGHVLELGCAPTDPVTLTVDGRPIARGELVDVEGRLGVRITQGRS